jgi:putative SOS response-associated peptidase YedK
MPVILPPETWDAWLGAEPAEAADLLELLVPSPAEELLAWPVDNRVGRVAENDAALIRKRRDVPALPGLDDEPPDWVR